MVEIPVKHSCKKTIILGRTEKSSFYIFTSCAVAKKMTGGSLDQKTWYRPFDNDVIRAKSKNS